MKILLALTFSMLVLVTHAQYKNITLAEPLEGQFPPLEPAVVINPSNPQNILVATALNRIIFSKDGGNTWLQTSVQSPYGVYGDPVLTADYRGNVYFVHLADPGGKGRSTTEWLDRIVCQRSTDGGVLWNPGTFTGLNPPKDNDKPWAAVHPKKELMAMTWTQFDQYGSTDKTCESNILFSKSTAKGEKWTEPIRINKEAGDCLDDDYTAMGATPFIDQEGRIFVVWAKGGQLYMDRSFDSGEIWLRSDIAFGQQMGGWNMTIPGLGRANGLPVISGDNSTGPFRGSVYVAFADQRFGSDDTDIWFVKSPNRGDNWSDPVRVNSDGKGKHQFMPWMTVDQGNGAIYVMYYDRRAYDDEQTDVYLAWSMDGGNHFNEVKISEKPFTPDPKKFFGDYTNISAHMGVIVPVWTRMDNGITNVIGAVIKHADLPTK
jgi:hypothetical protein